MRKFIAAAAIVLALFVAAVVVTQTASTASQTASRSVSAPVSHNLTSDQPEDAWKTFDSMDIAESFGETRVTYLFSSKTVPTVSKTSFVLESITTPGTYHVFDYAPIKSA